MNTILSALAELSTWLIAVAACLHLAKQAEAEVVGCGFLVELDFLNGRAALEDRKVFSLIHYGDENP